LYSPPDITWLAPAEMEVASSIDTSVTLTLRYPGESTATLTIEVGAPGRFEALWAPDGAAPPIAFHRLRARASAEEGFYGLGEYFDDVNHRGHVRAMQIEVDTSIESSYNEAHVPVPFVTGTQGWGLFVASERPGAFAVAADPAEPDLVEAAFGTAPASADGLRFHLFGAAHPLDVTALHYQVTGKPKVPAPWALGPWVWRDENKDQAEFLSDANTIRDLDLATTAMWIDRPYATAVNTFDFEPAQFPDPEAMIAEAHALGLRLALWHTPYLDEKSQADDTADLRQIAEAEGYYPPQSGLLLNKWGRPIDLTNPDAYAFWQSLIEKYGAMGIEGYKLDYMEDIVPGLTNARNEWQFADGTDERTQHSAFQRLYHRVYSETLPDDGGFLLCRAGTWGDQTHASIIWPGDLDATFHKHREVFDDNGEKVSGVGGLPASIVAGLSLGPSGFPFFGADTGGYKHSPPDKELFTRWFEQTAFSTVMQIGTSSNTVAWDPNGGPGFDDEMLGWYREYTRIHLRLFPYLWTHAMALAETGRPIARPLGLAYPEMGIHPNDTYLLGDDLLVAPVVEQGKTSREVAFPPGRWIHFLTGTVHEGGTTETVSAPLGQIPVFLREGGIVPLLRPTIDSLSPTTEPDRVDSFATTVGLLYARTAPAPLSKTAVYDGTALSIDSASATLTLTVNPGTVFTLGAQFEVLTPAAPTEVKDGDSTLPEAPDLQTLESSPAGWYHSAASGGTLHVRVPSGTHTVTATFPN
ncbi:MAG: glycoside hydrolase family 31 protein, partial [Polyangiaceae bacterium]